jgi:hypothetical protein
MHYILVGMSMKPNILFILVDQGRPDTLTAINPPHAPVDGLRALMEKTWPQMDAECEAAQEQLVRLPPEFRSSAQYRLPDGRLIDADDHLYEVRSQ